MEALECILRESAAPRGQWARAREASAITPEEKVELELTLHRFRQLVMELRSGVINRNNFTLWEIEILQDFGNCRVDPRHKRGILWQYQTAVEQQLAQGCATPMKVSEFLALQRWVTSSLLQ